MKNFYVHRLVAEVFIPNPEGKPIVDHIDRNPHNNSVTNLRWATISENRLNSDYHDKSKAKFGITPSEDRVAYARALYYFNKAHKR